MDGSRLAVAVLTCFLTSSLPAATIINGSFENLSSSYNNTPGADSMSGVAADGWTVSTNTPDWFLGAPGPTGLWLTPWGDFFAVGAAEGAGYREGLSQTIAGLTVGQNYRLEFQQANGLRFDQGSHIGIGNTGGWEVLLDGSPILTSASLNDNSTPTASFPGSWNLGSVIFQATAESQTIEFLAYGGGSSTPTFQFLDSVILTESQIPEPGTALLLSLLPLACLRRRRS